MSCDPSGPPCAYAKRLENNIATLQARVRELEEQLCPMGGPPFGICTECQASDTLSTQAQAKAAAAERAAIVAWLRSFVFDAGTAYESCINTLAEDIERGVHRKEKRGE